MSNNRLDVFVDLGENTSINDRVRLDIVNFEDLVFSSDTGEVNLSRYYPIKGRYLSIVNHLYADSD